MVSADPEVTVEGFAARDLLQFEIYCSSRSIAQERWSVDAPVLGRRRSNTTNTNRLVLDGFEQPRSHRCTDLARCDARKDLLPGGGVS